MIRVAVVDDHPHVAIALRSIFKDIPDISLVAECSRGSEILMPFLLLKNFVIPTPT